MNSRTWIVGLSAAALWTACAEPTSVAPDAIEAHRAASRGHSITALTQNLYVGTDLDAVIGALASPDPGDDVPALLSAIETLSATAYPARAGAIAAAIARTRPHAIGLQEVSQIDIDLTPLGVPFTAHLDFLAILAESLAVRGQRYVPAATIQNIVAEPLPGIRLVDFDVLLVDARRVSVRSGAGRTFAANIGIVAPGVEIKRGWVEAAVRIDGNDYVLVSTHLESGDGPGLAELRAAQAQELANSVPARGTVLLMGDFNDVPGSPMHRVLRGAHFVDSWAALRHAAHGPTCCQLADLANARSQLDRRIDYVWVRDGGRRLTGQVRRHGDEPSDRIAGPLHAIWPSDHAGVALTMIVP